MEAICLDEMSWFGIFSISIAVSDKDEKNEDEKEEEDGNRKEGHEG